MSDSSSNAFSNSESTTVDKPVQNSALTVAEQTEMFNDNVQQLQDLYVQSSENIRNGLVGFQEAFVQSSSSTKDKRLIGGNDGGIVRLKKLRRVEMADYDSSEDDDVPTVPKPRSFFDRLLTEIDDQISLMKKIIDYHAETQSYPFYAWTAETFIKNSIDEHLYATQLIEVVGMLNIKYHETRTEGNFEVLNERDRELFDLSQQIWGNDVYDSEEDERLLSDFEQTDDEISIPNSGSPPSEVLPPTDPSANDVTQQEQL